MKLPPAMTRLWEPDSYASLAGLAELAGKSAEFEDAHRVRALDHPWIGLTVTLPNGTGTIRKCLTHPLGRLMFDVAYPEPVPPVQNKVAVLVDRPDCHQMEHRFFADTLAELAT